MLLIRPSKIYMKRYFQKLANNKYASIVSFTNQIKVKVKSLMKD